MSQISSAGFAELLSLIAADDRFTERECQQFLVHADEYLSVETPEHIEPVQLEARNTYGRSDFLIIADVLHSYGTKSRTATFWELKAPQSLIMERDDSKSRYRPTKSLVKAETQLIHYCHQARHDRDFQLRWSITDPDDIRAGGIIIGRDDRWCTAEDNDRDAQHSFRIRNTALYSGRLKVYTWTRIAQILNPVSGGITRKT